MLTEECHLNPYLEKRGIEIVDTDLGEWIVQLPRLNDLSVFTRLLARSATGQPITTYTSHFHGPKPGGQLHIVLVDNGRTDLRAQPTYRESLQCIRCGACMNTCPVYRRSGGHSYSNTVPGPMGSVLAPAMDAARHHSLPYACTLCGSCTDVCPVKIPLHHQLLAWRGELAERKLIPLSKRLSMKLGRVVLGTSRKLELEHIENALESPPPSNDHEARKTDENHSHD